MELHIKPEPNPACANGCFVGLLEVCELQNKEYTSYLSIAERAKYIGLQSQSRKGEWLAGRLTAKYLFLHRLEMSPGNQSKQWRPTLLQLSAAALGVYSPWMYQQVEVLTQDGRPSLVWCGQERPESISLSHKGGVACASIAFRTPTAIDVETSVPRCDAFYRHNFTEVERHWVTRMADDEARGSNWFFTLLWTLKESALKLGWLKQSSLWHLPRIEIDDLPALNHIGPFWCNSAMGDDFVLFTARVREQRRVMQVQVAVTSTRNFVLTVMNPLIGVFN
jgi:4'-phosphopantetheinyl transferase EntD